MKNWDGVVSDDVTISDKKLTIIAGPCMLESLELGLKVGNFLKEVCASAGVNYIFKSSYDKANRTSKNTARGPGLQAGLQNLATVRNELGTPVLTDVHTPDDATSAATVCDVIQIPAFLSEQRDLLLAAAKTKKTIQIKKGQHTSFEQMMNSARYVMAAGNEKVLLCERGTSYGYQNLTVDFRSLIEWRKHGFRAVFDATHSAQLPGAGSGQSSGIRYVVPGLARAAAACGIDALFLEVHENPDKALSDGATQLDFKTAEQVIRTVARLSVATRL